MTSAIVRQWLILSMLPIPPRRIDTASIEERLRARGDRVHRRTIQRDLVQLSAVFPIIADDRSKPFGWRWEAATSRPEHLLAGPPPSTGPELVLHLRLRLRLREEARGRALASLGGREVRFDEASSTVTCRMADDFVTRGALLCHAHAIEVLSPLAIRTDIARLAAQALAVYTGA